MNNEYVESRGRYYYVAGTRVSLASVVYAFNRGEAPETILANYPDLDQLARVYGAVAYYLDHKLEIDSHLLACKQSFEASALPASTGGSALLAKLDLIRTELAARV